MNRVVLTGRMGKDAELRQTNSGKSVANFSLAVQKRIKPTDGSPDSDWFNIVVWGQSAEYAAQYLGKGRLIAVDGRLETKKWQDQNGNSRESVEIVAENIHGLDRGTDDGQGNSSGRSGTTNDGTQTRQTATTTNSNTFNPDEYDPFQEE